MCLLSNRFTRTSSWLLCAVGLCWRPMGRMRQSQKEYRLIDDDLTALTCKDEMLGHGLDWLCLLVLYNCSLFLLTHSPTYLCDDQFQAIWGVPAMWGVHSTITFIRTVCKGTSNIWSSLLYCFWSYIRSSKNRITINKRIRINTNINKKVLLFSKNCTHFLILLHRTWNKHFLLQHKWIIYCSCSNKIKT